MREDTAPSNRRERFVVGHQSWRSMLFLHWRADVAELRRRIPPGLAIDTYEGHAYVSLVAFTLARATLRGLPLPLVAPALELNLRTYVRTPHGPPGIFFFSLDATRLAYVAGASALLRHATHWAKGSSSQEGNRISYDFTRRRGEASFRVDARVVGPQDPATRGSLEHFLCERYVMYAAMPRGLVRMRVRHPAYALARAEITALREEIIAASGLVVDAQTSLAQASPGVDCALLAPERVPVDELLIHADDPADDVVQLLGGRHARRPAHWVSG
jgi:uncharacterized protein YqjF (DUF2071 family)